MDKRDYVSVDPAALTVGVQLEHPIYSSSDNLLVSKGSAVTEDVKRILTVRGIEKVQVHQDDVAKVVVGPTEAEEALAALPDGKSPEKPGEKDDSGPFNAENTGPPVRDRMVPHNRDPYDPQLYERFTAGHLESCETLNSVMRKAMQGRSVNGQDVREVATVTLDSMTEDCEIAITVALEAEDKNVSEQSLQTSVLGMAIAIELGLDTTSVRTIGATGLVCDWGMMQLSEDIRGAKMQLDEGQLFETQKVPALTANMLQKTTGLPRLTLPIAYQVHEQLDGTGYPRGRDADSIHPFAKILHVADLYTALTAPGPHRQGAMPYAAMEAILRKASTKSIDADVTRALLGVLSLFPIGSYVALSDKSLARVLRRNADDYWSPVVQLLVDKKGNRMAADDEDAIIVPRENDLEITRALSAPGRHELSLVELVDSPA